MEKNKKIYFVGIGGIGMSALALYLKKKNFSIFGCDKDLNQKTVFNLKKNKIEIFDENFKEDLIEKIKTINPDLIVLTNTVKNDHPVLDIAKNLNIKTIFRSKLLGKVLNKKKIIGITGSHGKTSTTGLISHILETEKIDPTIFIGGFLNSINENLKIGNSEYVVLEADDAYKSFLDINPFISIITTISLEHLETYKNIDDIKKTFLKYLNKTKKNGFIFINTDEPETKDLTKNIKREFFTYGLNKEEQNYAAGEIILNSFSSEFNLYKDKVFQEKVFLPLPGIHQIKNCISAIAASEKLGITIKDSINALRNHQGVERRLTKVGTLNEASIYDDYAHHPKEISNMLKVIQSILTEGGKKYLFFQPHKYTRTKALWNDFIKIFSETPPDKLYITDVFSAGDNFDDFFNSKNLCLELKKINSNIDIKYVPFEENFNSLLNEINKIKDNLTEKDLIFCMGAGKLDKFAKKISEIN